MTEVLKNYLDMHVGRRAYANLVTIAERAQSKSAGSVFVEKNAKGESYLSQQGQNFVKMLNEEELADRLRIPSISRSKDKRLKMVPKLYIALQKFNRSNHHA